MTDIASLKISIDTLEAKVAAKDLDNLSKSSKNAESSSSKLSESFVGMKGALASLGITLSAAKIIQVADSFSVMQSKLGLVTESIEELNTVQTELLRIANEQRKPVEEVTELYVKAATSAKELGASQKDVFKFTEAVSAALTINGTTTQAAAGVLLQLGQAIGGTKIQMQEYNSLIDGARPLLQSVAQNLDKAGGSVNKLTQLVRDGEISSKEFFDAIVKGSDDMTEKAGEMSLTVGQALTIMGNNMSTYIGFADGATGATNELAQSIKSFSESAGLRTAFEAIAVLFINVKYTFEQIGNEIGGIAAQIAALARLDFSAFTDIREQMLRDARIARERVDLQSENILNPLRFNDISTTKATPSGDGNKPDQDELDKIAKLKEKKRQAYLDFRNEMLEMDKKYLGISNDIESKIIDESRENRRKSIEYAVEKQKEFNAEVEKIKDSVDPTREYTRQINSLSQMFNMGRLTADEFSKAAQMAQKDMLGFANKSKDAFEELKDAINGYSREMSRSLAEFALNGKTSFGDMVNSMMMQLLTMINQKYIFDPLFKGISGAIDSSQSSGGGIGDFLGNLASNIFGGFRANGGSVTAGKSYVVGERGMELFTPNTSGSITPNNKMGGNQVVNIQVIEAEGTRANVHQQQNQDGSMSIKLIVEQLYGVMNRDLQRGGGIAPTLERRYGLNRMAGT